MIRLLTCAAGILLLVGCGGGGTAKIKGRVVENGEPIGVSGQAALVFVPMSADGKPEKTSYAAGLNPDGTFELVASGGEVPTGSYAVTLEVNTAKGAAGTTGIAKYKGKYSNVKLELKSGANDLTLDLTKPNG